MHPGAIGLPLDTYKEKINTTFFSFLLDPIIQRYNKMWLSLYIFLPYAMINMKQDMCLVDNGKLKGVNTSVGRISQGVLGITWASLDHYSLKPFEY
jgi:hypothetical protein